tara:strand:- start:277 stop:1065 length:789 start_codon:yes stop_codon:yes gene_type:complete
MDITKLLYAKRELLLKEAEEFSNLTGHPGEKGKHNEGLLVRFLNENLPSRIKIHTGFIECADRAYEQSSQQDLIFFDDTENAPFYKSEEWSIFAIEMVLGTLEVKTSINAQNLKRALEANLKIRDMANSGKHYLKLDVIVSDYASPESFEINQGQHQYSSAEVTGTLPPRFYIFAYKTDISSPTALQKQFKNACASSGGHCHGLYVLEQDWFVYKKPYKEEYPVVSEHAWESFLDQLKWTLLQFETLPANLRKYKPEISDEI